jgi:hypothetical protein
VKSASKAGAPPAHSYNVGGLRFMADTVLPNARLVNEQQTLGQLKQTQRPRARESSSARTDVRQITTTRAQPNSITTLVLRLFLKAVQASPNISMSVCSAEVQSQPCCLVCCPS